MGKEIVDVRLREPMVKENLHSLQIDNMSMQGNLWDKDTQLATMYSLCMESMQYRYPSKSYVVYLMGKWLKFQITTLSQHGSLPFQNYKQFIEF